MSSETTLLFIYLGILIIASLFVWLSRENGLDLLFIAGVVIGVEGHLWHLQFGQNGYYSQIIQNTVGIAVLLFIYATRFSVPTDKLTGSSYLLFTILGFLNEGLAYFFIGDSNHGALVNYAKGEILTLSNESLYAYFGIYVYLALGFVYFTKRR